MRLIVETFRQLVMRRLRPPARYWTTKLRCPAAVTARPKPGMFMSQNNVHSAPGSARAFCTNAGVNLVRMMAPFRNVTWPASKWRGYDQPGAHAFPTEDASAVTFGLNHDLLDGVGGNVVLENSMPVNLMRITLPPATLLCTALAMVLLAGEASQAQSNLPVCPLIATGGTIAMKIDPVKQAPVPAISGEDLLATVPEVAKHARVEVKNVSNVPSDYMDPPRWIALTKEVAQNLERPEVAGVVVSHGTDTLEETAWWLDLTINSEKPVILIGAQRNASEKDFDGPRNLLNAVRICVDPQSKGKGAMIALNDQINAARDVTKTHTSSVETFKSGDFGFLGVVDQDRLIFARAPLRRQHIPLKTDSAPPVEIVAMYGGADGRLIKAAVDQGAKGIVVQALGWGNMNQPMFAAMKEAISKGVPVVIASRVPTGRVLPNYGFEGGGKTLFEAGAVMADDLSPQKARILLMLLLQNGITDQKGLQAAFSK